MRRWQLAGLSSVNVREATIVNWMLLGVYFTRELLHKMKKVNSPQCLACDENTTENLSHLILYCQFYQIIREEYLPKLVTSNKSIGVILNNEDNMVISILDPISSNLPQPVRRGWDSVKKVLLRHV